MNESWSPSAPADGSIWFKSQFALSLGLKSIATDAIFGTRSRKISSRLLHIAGRSEHGDPGEIASGPIEARDKAFLDWIVAANENDRSGRCCRFGGKGRGRA